MPPARAVSQVLGGVGSNTSISQSPSDSFTSNARLPTSPPPLPRVRSLWGDEPPPWSGSSSSRSGVRDAMTNSSATTRVATAGLDTNMGSRGFPQTRVGELGRSWSPKVTRDGAISSPLRATVRAPSVPMASTSSSTVGRVDNRDAGRAAGATTATGTSYAASMRTRQESAKWSLAATVFDRVDSNHDGVITREEFNKALLDQQITTGAGRPT
eukprot:TRINITY_DN59236_c0_g1_i1.p1 TRINITY_DN59236_c0_g1~~TRINITY_DN59236_c0_g1_i1.p1  ORF type:complete len:221 (-),score=22.39 TRINITY_DN59236_c0_g1_i1:95-733(-)